MQFLKYDLEGIIINIENKIDQKISVEVADTVWQEVSSKAFKTVEENILYPLLFENNIDEIHNL